MSSSIGVAFSGGGVSAAIGAACACNAMTDIYNISSINNLTISTVSGGGIGYGLHANTNQRMFFPPYKRNVTLEELSDYQDLYNTNDNRWCESDNNGRKISIGRFANALHWIPFTMLFTIASGKGMSHHWWTSIIERIFDIVCVDNIVGGDIPWLSSFAVQHDDHQGVHLPSSTKSLHHIVTDISIISNTYGESTCQNEQDLKLQYPLEQHTKHEPRTLLDALSFTSAFWAAPLLSSRYGTLFDSFLLKTKQTIVLDGGVVDTTGIVGLLQKQTDHIIAFYNNNIPLSELESPIAYLFGVDVTTDSMNSLLGPSLSQVFDSELYPGVISNLTNSKVGIAQLQDVNVLSNKVMNVESYVMKNLIIVSNIMNDGFELNDSRIMKRLSSSWPDSYMLVPPELDANTLCMFNDWKVRNNHELFESILMTG